MELFDLAAERERLALTPDCSSCFGLCCVAHAFRASASFAFDKSAGEPCVNLLEDFGCAVHRTLRQRGFSGCTAYTCYGAGQKVAQRSFGGIDWRRAPETAELMFQTFPIVRQLNEILWFITEALDRCSSVADHDELLGLLDDTVRLASTPADEMSWGDVDDHCLIGETLLGRVSASVRTAALSGEQLSAEQLSAEQLSAAEHQRPAVRSAKDRLRQDRRLNDRRSADLFRADLRGVDGRGTDLRGADLRGVDRRGVDLRGVDLRGVDLRGADLWGAVLSGADLSGADLRWADLMGADLGRADLSAADLSAAIFLTQGQLELAHGNARTLLSGPLRIPAHWSGADGDSTDVPDGLGNTPGRPVTA